MDLFLNVVMASCLVLAALCLPDGKNQTFWLFSISCVFVTLSICVPVQVWHFKLILSIPDIAFLSTFATTCDTYEQKKGFYDL